MIKAQKKELLPKARFLFNDKSWIIGGDFNLSETFDNWPGGPRGNLEYLEKMEKFGLTEYLRKFQGRLTPTFRNPRDGNIAHQMDHIFVTSDFLEHLSSCETGDRNLVFDRSLSVHLPIIADFELD